jgi:hypothetical protein
MMFSQRDRDEACTYLEKGAPGGVCSPEEIIGMSAKAFRKGFSNWASQHPEEAVQRNAFTVQDHSEDVQMTNYHVASE